MVAGENRAILPADLDDLADVLSTHPEATIVAGSTDVGLWITKFMRPIIPAVFIAHLAGLKTITAETDEMTIGAGVTYSEAAEAIANISPSLARFWNRIGGPQVRNMGTIGGNIANGSPIRDTPHQLIALGEEISLRQGRATRRIKLQDFFVRYGEQDRAPGEVLTHIHVPRPDPMAVIASHKISKRRDEDISSVCGAILVRLDQGVVADIRIAYGGMAATPKRAAGVERALIGQAWTTETIDAAMLEFANDLKPLTDWRVSADYRLKVAANLFAAVAAIAAKRFGRAVKLRPDRDEDMIATGKRHDFPANYDVGFDADGRILAVNAELAARCGFSSDLSGPVTDRALFHADNAYFFPHVQLRSRPLKTNTASNTAYRGFGGAQGVVAGRSGTPAHPCPFNLQNPAGLGYSARFQHRACQLEPECAPDDQAFQSRG